MAHNIEVFSSEVDKFQRDYIRQDEKYIIKNLFCGKKVLVLGCGAGRLLMPIYREGFEITGDER